jgi:hypothetical protein
MVKSAKKLKPQKDAPGAPRVPMSFRVTPELKAQLEKASRANGRSITQDIEIRLANSFRDSDTLDEALVLAFGPAGAALALIVGEIAKWMMPHLSPGDWVTDEGAFDEMARAVNRALAFLDPRAPKFPVPDKIVIGELVATMVLAQLGKTDGPNAPWAKSILGKFDPTVSRRIAERAKQLSGGKP